VHGVAKAQIFIVIRGGNEIHESNEVTQIMQSTTGNRPLRITSHKVEFYREHIIDVPSNLVCVGCKRARVHMCVCCDHNSFFPSLIFQHCNFRENSTL